MSNRRLHKFNERFNTGICCECGNSEDWHELTVEESKTSGKVKPIYATGRTSEETCVDCSGLEFFLPRATHCLNCHHDNQKDTTTIHSPGKCEKCNCGESDIEHSNDTSNKAARNADAWYRGDGHYVSSARLSYLRNGRPRRQIKTR